MRWRICGSAKFSPKSPCGCAMKRTEVEKKQVRTSDFYAGKWCGKRVSVIINDILQQRMSIEIEGKRKSSKIAQQIFNE